MEWVPSRTLPLRRQCTTTMHFRGAGKRLLAGPQGLAGLDPLPPPGGGGPPKALTPSPYQKKPLKKRIYGTQCIPLSDG